MEIQAYYYDGKSSARREVKITLYGKHVAVTDGGEVLCEYPLSAVKIKERIGSSPRSLYFPDGSKCETMENDQVDSMIQSAGLKNRGGVLYQLETKVKYIAASLIFAVLFMLFMAFYGVNAVSYVAAFSLPDSVGETLGRHTLEVLDSNLFDSSELSVSKRQEITGEFEKLLGSADGEVKYQVLFRKGGVLGANAMALPDGTVVLTDELVALAENTNEVLAVLAHEMGHVEHRHGLRSVLHSSFFSMLMAVFANDLSAVTVGVSTLLMESRYSRDFEWEADNYALAMLDEHGIDKNYFAEMLRKLSMSQAGDGGVLKYISTHPAAVERIENITGRD